MKKDKNKEEKEEIEKEITKLEKKNDNTNVKAFLTSIIVIFILMVVTFILTKIIPSGSYERIEIAGKTIIDTSKPFTLKEVNFPFWKWLLSPFLVLKGNTTLIAIIAFLVVIGGVFNCLNKCDLMNYMLDVITNKYGKKKYKLLFIITLFFMLMGALIGSFEECVPLVPIVIGLVIGLGFDKYVGLFISILAVGYGFSTGITNPFTVGLAQELAGLPMFSGISLRIVSFIILYLLLCLFIKKYAEKVDTKETKKLDDFKVDKKKQAGLKAFAIIMGIGIVAVISSGLIKALQDYTLILVAVMFLIAGIVSPKLAGMKAKDFFREFKNGMISMLPAVLMIMMASSIKYIMEEAMIMDTILNYFIKTAANLPKTYIILFIYLIVLVMDLFISSGSAKAFMLMPLIVPLVETYGISTQLCVLAYAFGDGFSNIMYPTNPVLLISLGLTKTSYKDWLKKTWKFLLATWIITNILLIIGLYIGY